MAFLFGIPKKLIQRLKAIEIDTHYYDKDVVPSAQNIFTFNVNEKNKTATITGLINDDYTRIIIPYKIQYDQTSEALLADVIELSENCFSNYKNLKNVTIPNTIHIIPKNCFINCSSLETVNIPTSVYTIKSKAFNSCNKLNSVFIPYSVNTIEDGAFLNCENLKIICYKHSKAEEYAITNKIPYSLISYTLDEDITENSENLVTSGIIYKHVDWLKNRITEVYNTLDKRITDVRTELINKIIKVQTNLTNHENNKNNPHEVTKLQVGLSNVDNTSDLDKPISNATNTEFKKINDIITSHINDKDNPHNDSNFNNATLTGYTSIMTGTLTNVNTISETINDETILKVTEDSLINKKYLDEELSKISSPEIGAGYQTIRESSLETDAKTIPSAINEIADKVNTVNGKLIGDTWNTVSLNKKYSLSWRFLNQPYCFTDEGISVDYRINNKRLVNNCDAFDIYVPVNCNYTLSTAALNEISGYPIDYLLVNYYYTGADGKDLDTVTGISNTNWPSSIKSTVGYGHQSEIKYNDVTLIKFGGDNTGGGNTNADTKYYESIYFNVKAIQNILPDDDIEVILYGTWYSEKLNGNIHIQFITYESTNEPSLNINDNKLISVNGATETYSNDDMICSIVTKKGSTSDYKNSYTPAFKLIFRKSTDNSNYRTISIQALS